MNVKNHQNKSSNQILLENLTLPELWQLFPIILEEYNPVYPKWYEAESNNIIQGIRESHGENIIKRVNHIGSTAVPGLLSKPTIDILLELDKSAHIENVVETLTAESLTAEPDQWRLINQEKNPPQFTLVKGYTPVGFAQKVFHLHIRTYGDWAELYFRDYLLKHPDVADEYGLLKMDLMGKYKFHRDNYTDSKTEFINKYTKLARDEFGDKYSE